MPAVRADQVHNAAIRNTIFIDNVFMDYVGGAILAFDSANMNIERCQFHYNGDRFFDPGTEEWGGAIGALGSQVVVTDSIFLSNHAEFGGAVYQNDSLVTYINDIFAGNQATYLNAGSPSGGSALMLTLGGASVHNCTFYDNEFLKNVGSWVETVPIFGEGAPEIYVANSILQNDPEQSPTFEMINTDDPGKLTVHHSNVQGYASGDGNIDNPACFIGTILPIPVTIVGSTYDVDKQQTELHIVQSFGEHTLGRFFLRRVTGSSEEPKHWMRVADNLAKDLLVWGAAHELFGLTEGSDWSSVPFELVYLGLNQGSACLDAGDSADAPEFDIFGTPRHADLAPDMGAIEYLQ
jgi:hypothetical protein